MSGRSSSTHEDPPGERLALKAKHKIFILMCGPQRVGKMSYTVGVAGGRHE